MGSSHFLLSKFTRTQGSKHLAIHCHSYHQVSTNVKSFVSRNNESSLAKMPLQCPSQDLSKVMATRVSNCVSVQQLNEIYAHVIRTNFLELHPAPFHWNNIMRSYAKLDFPVQVLHIYIAMSRAYVFPDTYTLPILLKATCHAFNVVMGRQLHAVAIRHGLQTNVFSESGFINLYSKSGEFENARNLFEENCYRMLGSWNAMIGGLSQGGRSKEAVFMFIDLKNNGFEPDDVTMVCVTSACGSLGNLNLAFQLHKCVFHAKRLGESDLLMMNSLIDMYGKCGRMDLANRVFYEMHEKNVSSWTSMIVGYAMNGLVNEALDSFLQMKDEDVRPNHVTFVGVLSACVHGGRVQKGKFYFNMMKNKYGIVPKLPHYGCMVDLLGRAGLLEEARELVEEMPMKPNVVIWGCLMGACEKYGNVRMGEWVANHLQELEPWNDGVYVVLSNIYADNGLWNEVEKIRRIMKDTKLPKIPAYSLSASSN